MEKYGDLKFKYEQINEDISFPNWMFSFHNFFNFEILKVLKCKQKKLKKLSEMEIH